MKSEKIPRPLRYRKRKRSGGRHTGRGGEKGDQTRPSLSHKKEEGRDPPLLGIKTCGGRNFQEGEWTLFEDKRGREKRRRGRSLK